MGQVLERAPFERITVRVQQGRIDDHRVYQLEGTQVVLQTVADEYRIVVDNLQNVLLHLGQPFDTRLLQRFFSNTRELGVIIDDFVFRQHVLVVDFLHSRIDQSDARQFKPAGGVAHLAVDRQQLVLARRILFGLRGHHEALQRPVQAGHQTVPHVVVDHRAAGRLLLLVAAGVAHRVVVPSRMVGADALRHRRDALAAPGAEPRLHRLGVQLVQLVVNVERVLATQIVAHGQRAADEEVRVVVVIYYVEKREAEQGQVAGRNHVHGRPRDEIPVLQHVVRQFDGRSDGGYGRLRLVVRRIALRVRRVGRVLRLFDARRPFVARLRRFLLAGAGAVAGGGWTVGVRIRVCGGAG